MDQYKYNAKNERCWECNSKELECYDFPHYKCNQCGEVQYMQSAEFTGYFTDQQWQEYKSFSEEEQQRIYNEITDLIQEDDDYCDNIHY